MEELPRQESEKSPERVLRSAAESIPSEKHPERNEDAVINRPDLGLFAVFDGLGGHAAGEKASGLARDCITGFFERVSAGGEEAAKNWQALLAQAMREASEELGKLRAEHSGSEGAPDTTATVVKIAEDEGKTMMFWAHVGDSRLYLKRAEKDSPGALKRVTQDDNVLGHRWPELEPEKRREIEEALDSAETREDLEKMTAIGVPLDHLFGWRNAMFRTLGTIGSGKDIFFQSGVLELQKGDIALLSSDGVSDNLTAEEMARAADSARGADRCAKSLVGEALDRSRNKHIRAKPDDMSVVAVEVMR